MISEGSPLDPEPLAKADNAAYVIYTSGSTGRPQRGGGRTGAAGEPGVLVSGRAASWDAKCSSSSL